MKIFRTLLFFLPSLSLAAIISISPPDSRYKSITQKIIEEKLADLSDFFDVEASSISIELFNSEANFYKATGLSHHVAGALTVSDNKIYLKTPTVNKISLNEYKKVIYHELIHALQNQKIRLNTTPDWFNEGLAVYFSGGFTLKSKIQLSKYMLSPPIPDLQSMHIIHHQYHNYSVKEYILAASIIEFIHTAFGDTIFTELLTDLSHTKNFNRSIKNILFTDPETLNQFWHTYLDNHYKILYLLDLQYIIWLFLPILFIFSFIMKQFLTQLILKKWKYEQFEKNINSIFTFQ